MIFRSLSMALVALALVGAPTVQAQEAQAAPAAPAQPDSTTLRVQRILGELQQVNARLEAIQQQALADPALDSAQQSLNDRIRAAMQQADPTLDQGLARVAELESEAAAAQQAGDQAKLQELGAEAQQIQARFLAAQQQALQQPELASDLEAFQAQLEAKMVELDPQAGQLIARFRELQEQLAAAMQGA